MNSANNPLRDLFFETGLPEAYCLARRMERQTEPQEEKDHALYHTGNRPAGGGLPGGG